MKIAVQMDPLAKINIAGDTTFALMLEAQARGYMLYYYEPDRLFLRDGVVYACAQNVTLADKAGAHFAAKAEEIIDLRVMDVVLLRQDPPFDMHYLSTTYLLEKIHPATLVVNNPRAVRDAPEKLFATDFDGLLPPTLISRDMATLQGFRDEFGDIVLKPLYGHGGGGVFRVARDNENFSTLVEMFFQTSRDPIIAQQYLPDVRAGDKRVILVEGEAVGALNRVPQTGEIRSNMVVGGVAQVADLSARDYEIAAKIGPKLRENGIIFAGIDVIGDYLTEVNVTSPTGIRAIKALSGLDLSVTIWDAIEARRATIRIGRI